MKVTIEISEQELKDLKQVRNYFGEHDKTMFEHAAYAIVDRAVKKIEQAAHCQNSVKRSVKITKTQINSIISIRNDIEVMVGCADDPETDNTWKNHIKNIDKFLLSNDLKL